MLRERRREETVGRARERLQRGGNGRRRRLRCRLELRGPQRGQDRIHAVLVGVREQLGRNRVGDAGDRRVLVRGAHRQLDAALDAQPTNELRHS